MTRYSPLDEGKTMYKLVSGESFNQLLSLVKDEHKDLALSWWSKQLVQDGNLSDGELIMLSCFIKHGAYIECQGDEMRWSKPSVTIAILRNSIDDLLSRNLIQHYRQSIRLCSSAAAYCCNNCYHEGIDRFRLMCGKCSGLGVVRNPRK